MNKLYILKIIFFAASVLLVSCSKDSEKYITKSSNGSFNSNNFLLNTCVLLYDEGAKGSLANCNSDEIIKSNDRQPASIWYNFSENKIISHAVVRDANSKNNIKQEKSSTASYEVAKNGNVIVVYEAGVANCITTDEYAMQGGMLYRKNGVSDSCPEVLKNYVKELSKVNGGFAPVLFAKNSAEQLLQKGIPGTPQSSDSASAPISIPPVVVTETVPVRIAATLPVVEAAPVAIDNSPFSPSFDCAKASNGQEKLVCGDRELSKLDVDLSQAYLKTKEKTADKDKLKKEQLEWIKFSLRACSDKTCLMGAYQKRISELR